MEIEVKDITLYADGACRANGKPEAKGGWGAILKCGEYEKEFSGLLPGELQTNQRAEITAVMMGLLAINKKYRDVPVTIYTDSEYVIGTMTKGWKRNKNNDLWNKLQPIVNSFTQINWVWVKGHATNEFNNRCDKLATDAYKGGE